MNKHGGYSGKQAEILDFSININPLGMPKEIKKKLKDSMGNLELYPEITGKSTIEKLSRDLKMPKETILLGNGAIELIYLFSRSLKKGKALIIQPTFNEYERALKLYHWEVEHFILKKEDKFKIDPKKLIKRIERTKPQVVFLCNPNNPTGTVYSRKTLAALIKAAPKKTVWFIDESFMDFTKEEDASHFIKEAPVFLLRSLTKFYALPGLRIGYSLGSEKMIACLKTYKEPWTINALGLIAARLVYDQVDYAKKTREYIERERQRVYHKLNKIQSLKVYETETDFHLCRLLKGKAEELREALEKKGIYIRTCEDFKGLDETYFRIAIKRKEDNDYLIKCLKEWRE